MTDYYSVLGITNTSSQEEIKQAYRKLAMKHHPDRTGGDDTEFKKIQEAYSVLGDEDSRRNYDSPKPQFNQEFGFGGIPPGFEDLFAHFGNNFGPFANRQQPPRNKSVSIQASVTLTDAFHGKELIATINLPSGKEQMIEVRIPAGIQDGTNLRLAGLGDNSYPNAPRGDIMVNVRIINNTKFTRNGDDLIFPIEISMWDAVLGSSIIVETIEHKTLEIKINPGTQHGQILAVQNAGMPNMNHPNIRGRLLLQTSVKIPTLLSDEQREFLEKSKPQ
jgi:DnaJ-class molecular chaperone